MTKNQYYLRMVLYTLIAMLTIASTDVQGLEAATPNQWVAFVIKTVLAGAIALRAFVDKSSSQVK